MGLLHAVLGAACTLIFFSVAGGGLSLPAEGSGLYALAQGQRSPAVQPLHPHGPSGFLARPTARQEIPAPSRVVSANASSSRCLFFPAAAALAALGLAFAGPRTLLAAAGQEAPAAEEAAESTPGQSDSDGPQVVPGSFIQWYEYEKEREAYEKENPVDTVAVATNRLRRPLTTLGIVLAGFYIVPVVRGLAESYREGSDPVEALKAAFEADKALSVKPVDMVENALAPK